MTKFKLLLGLAVLAGLGLTSCGGTEPNTSKQETEETTSETGGETDSTIENYTRTFVIDEEIPEDVTVRIVGSFNGWATTYGDDNVLLKGSDGYTFNFGTREIGETITYKLVLTNDATEAMGNFWAYQGSTPNGDKDGNGTITVASASDPVIDEWSFANIPEVGATVNVSVSFDGYTLPAGYGVAIHSNLTDPNWATVSLSDSDANGVWEGTINSTAGAHELVLKLSPVAGDIQGGDIWVNSAGGNLSVNLVEGINTLNLVVGAGPVLGLAA